MTSASPFDAFDLPPPWPESLLPRIRAHNAKSATRLVVLDDDPLGGQCMHDTPVLTAWDARELSDEIDESDTFLLLTNTRSLGRAEALERARDIGDAVLRAAADAAILPTPIWRSDSTLRGHFWWEMQAFAEQFPAEGVPEPVFVFLPYFGDGGRFTLNDTQYVLQDGTLVPVAETEFARDPAFSYSHSYLPAWLESHTEGQIKAADVMTIGHEDLRRGGPERIAALLTGAAQGGAVVVNATTDRDLEVFVAGLQAAEDASGYFLCSGTSSFVRVRAGLEVRRPLDRDELGATGNTGGLTIVGSYVERTGAQLGRALALPGLHAVELDIDALMDASTFSGAIANAAVDVANRLVDGEDVVLHAGRDYVEGAGATLGRAISALLDIVQVRPRYLLVKGGSTASDIATGSLGVRRALVLGQVLPGVPVWRLGPESRWPGLPLVIFPGNVGGPESLAEVLQRLRAP